MMIRSIAIPAVLVILAATSAVASPAVGEKAPPVKAEKWFNGSPSAVPGDGGTGKHIFLVEFWATWCAPCVRNIPHIATLQDKYKKDGLIVLGISNEDEGTVAPFVKRMKKMTYHVGIDDEMATSNKYMDDISGIPHAYLVDKSGIVVWSGHPGKPQLESTIKAVLDGKFDLEAAKGKVTRKKKLESLMEDFNHAYREQDKDEIFKILDKMMTTVPEEVQPYMMKRHFLGEFEMEDQIPALEEKMESALRDSLEGMGAIVAMELGRPPPERSADRLWRCATRAEKLSEGDNPEVLAMVAQVQCELGMLDTAIKTQARAVELSDGEEVQKKALAYYKSAKSLAQRPQSGTPDDNASR